MLVDQLHARALLDSGSMVTLDHTGVFGRVGSIKKMLRVVCILGGTKENPLLQETITTACGTVTHDVRVIPNLIHDIIVGQNFPLFVELWDYVSKGLSKKFDISVPFEGWSIVSWQTLENNIDGGESVADDVAPVVDYHDWGGCRGNFPNTSYV